MKKYLIIIMVLILVVSLGGCSRKTPPMSEQAPLIMGKIEHQYIDVSAAQFSGLNQGEFKEWYEENYKIKGSHSLVVEKKRYVLVGAGEKAGSGYILSNLQLEGKADKIEAQVELKLPSANKIPPDLITYPHLLAEIADDGREIFLQEINEIPGVKEGDLEKAAGIYVGRIDSSSIEIKVDGAGAEAFALTDNVQTKLNNGEVQDGDQVSFKYIPAAEADAQPSIIDIQKK